MNRKWIWHTAVDDSLAEYIGIVEYYNLYTNNGKQATWSPLNS